MTKEQEVWPIPATAQAILAARIDRLPAEDKRLLQAASVIGKHVPFTLLRAIADMPEHSLRRALTDLQAAEFLYETSVFPDLEYTFKHALTHEVAYASVLHERRRALHGRIVAALETLYPDRLAEQVERLAHHAFRGELWDKAVTYLRQAGAKALAHSAYREAVNWFEQALTALHPLPDTHQKVERAIDLRLDLRQSLFPLNELATVWRYADYERTGIGYHHSLSVGQLGEAYLLADQVEYARACADRAVMLARGRGERGYEAWALRLLGDIGSHGASPDVTAAAAHYGAAMSLASELEMRPLVAHCHHGLARLYRRTGNPGPAQEHLAIATAMYGDMGMTHWVETLEKDGPFVT